METILIVDDEPSMTRMIRMTLEMTKRYQVREENHAVRALTATVRTVTTHRPASPPPALRAEVSDDQRRLLDTCASLLAISLERIHYIDVAQKSTVQIESERLRNSLLSSEACPVMAKRPASNRGKGPRSAASATATPVPKPAPPAASPWRFRRGSRRIPAPLPDWRASSRGRSAAARRRGSRAGYGSHRRPCSAPWWRGSLKEFAP